MLGLAAGRVWQKINIGRLRIDVELRNGEPFIMMTQGEPRVSAPYHRELRNVIISALGQTHT
jgi:hypothetical protein